MMKCIVFENSDGTISTRGGFGPNFLREFNGDRDAALQYVLTNLVPIQNPDAINPRTVDVEFPPDKVFRGAWKVGVGKIYEDMPEAREIHREHLRQLRAPLLAALDIEYMRADERGDTLEKQSIAARKQALRDVTADPEIDAAKTPEELKAVIPAVLA